MNDHLLTPGTIRDSGRFYNAVHVLVQKRVIYPHEERLAWSARARVLSNPALRNQEGAFLKFFLDPSTQKYLTGDDEERGGIDMYREIQRQCREGDAAPDKYTGLSPKLQLPEPRMRPLTEEEMDEKIERARSSDRFRQPGLFRRFAIEELGEKAKGCSTAELVELLGTSIDRFQGSQVRKLIQEIDEATKGENP